MRPHNNFIVKIAVLTIIALLGLSLTAFAQATPPGRINYQGVLRDASGNPLDGPQTMTFRLYDASSAGTLLWEEIYDDVVKPPEVTVDNGLFTVALGDPAHRNAGSEAAFANVFSNHTDVYLAVRVGSDPEMTPRIKVVSAPFAVNSSALGGRDSTAYAKLASAETITADWVNTAHPWSDNEVSDTLTIGPGSTIDSSIAVGNANTLDGFDSSYFLNTSSTAQTKAGKLTLNGTTDYGLDASGPAGGAYLHDSNSSGDAYVGYGDYGIQAFGNTAGGYFKDRDSYAYAYVGYGNYGIQATGVTMGGDFKNLSGSGYAYVGDGDDGIWAQGNAMGGYFKDKDDTGYANVGYGDRGIEAYGSDMGGYFEDSIGHGHAYVGFNENGISAYGNNMGGYFADPNASGKANVGYGDRGIEAYGSDMGGYFEESGGTGYADVGYNDIGIAAFGNNMGGYFKDSDGASTGYAAVGYGDKGIEAYGNYSGGYFEDIDSVDWANVGSDIYKITGNGTVSFVQNHPTDKDRVIVYACPEGDEVATYTRGTAKLINGEARVKLGETFKWVTNPDIGLTVHLTPEGDCNGLFVKSKSTSELVVKELNGGKSNTVFDYIVYGLRIGFEESSIVQEKQQEAYIPSFKDHRERYTKYPELRAYNALERFKDMESSVRGVKASSIDLSRAKALKNAIHEYDPATDPPVEDLFGYHGEKEGENTPPVSQPAPTGPAGPASGTISKKKQSPSDDFPAGDVETNQDSVAKVQSTLPCFPATGNIEAGDVVTMDPMGSGNILVSTTQADPRVLGIAAGEGYRCRGDKKDSRVAAKSRVPVATFGVTKCKVDAGFGPILPGDLLVTSPTPGHAMRADNPAQGTVIGKALEKLDTGTGLIKILIMPR